MKTSTINGSLWALVSLLGVACFAPSCGDGDPTTNPIVGSGGTTGKGGSSGKGGSTGGSTMAGASGQGGGGGICPGPLCTSGGTGGTAGASGTAGSAGTLGGEGGEAGAGGGEGGQGGAAPVTLYDFENGVQGWITSTAGATVSQSGDQHFDGASSLKIAHAVIDNGSVIAQINKAQVWPGTVLTFHAFLPTGFDTTGGTYFQAFAQGDNYNINFETAGNSSRMAVPGGWTTWTYAMPNTFPGGLQVLGFQVGDNSGGGTIAAGDIYIDAITATGGTQNCAMATPAGLHNFETSPLDGNVYKLGDGDTQIAISQSADRAFMGNGSMKVAFTALPAGSTANPTKRIFYIDKPNIYCGQTVTVHVFLPTGSDGLTFQVYGQYNNYDNFVGTGPLTTVTQNDWNTATFNFPTNVGPGGIQRVGLEFWYTGSSPLTANAYVDAITW